MNPSLCGVDLCISALGLGFNLTIGTEQIVFMGYAEIPNLEKASINLIMPIYVLMIIRYSLRAASMDPMDWHSLSGTLQ
jgi:hypothetical protein